MKTVIATRAARAVVGAALATALMTSPGHSASADAPSAAPSASPSGDAQRVAPAASVASAQAAPGKHRRTPVAKKDRRGNVRVLRVSDSRPRVGDTVTLSGRTHRARRTVVLQVRDVAPGRKARGKRSGWTKAATTTADRRGRFSFTRTVADVDAHQYRVRVERKTSRPVRSKASRRAQVRHSRAVTVRPRAAVQESTRGPRPTPKATPTRTPTHKPTPGSTRTPKPTTAPTPQPTADPADRSASLRAELDRLVRGYRAEHGVRTPEHNDCLATWASGFAQEMSRNGLFAHSNSSEWEGSVLTSVDACADSAPTLVRQEAIARVTGDDPAAVAAQALSEMKQYWAHDEVLLDDHGTTRAMEVGVAPHPVHGWYVVVVFAAD